MADRGTVGQETLHLQRREEDIATEVRGKSNKCEVVSGLICVYRNMQCICLTHIRRNCTFHFSYIHILSKYILDSKACHFVIYNLYCYCLLSPIVGQDT